MTPDQAAHWAAETAAAHLRANPRDARFAVSAMDRLRAAGYVEEARYVARVWDQARVHPHQSVYRGVLLVLAVLSFVIAVPLTAAWLTNLGPVYAWHLMGPVCLISAAWLAWEALRK